MTIGLVGSDCSWLGLEKVWAGSARGSGRAPFWVHRLEFTSLYIYILKATDCYIKKGAVSKRLEPKSCVELIFLAEKKAQLGPKKKFAHFIRASNFDLWADSTLFVDIPNYIRDDSHVLEFNIHLFRLSDGCRGSWLTNWGL